LCVRTAYISAYTLNSSSTQNPPLREQLIQELVGVFFHERYVVHGAQMLDGYKRPPPIANTGFGDGKPRTPDIVGVDAEKQRIVFGLVRENRESLDSEDALTEYNVLLDHKADQGDRASVVLVMLPSALVHEFTGIVTHYIHREYWHRIVPVASTQALG